MEAKLILFFASRVGQVARGVPKALLPPPRKVNVDQGDVFLFDCGPQLFK